MKPKNFIGVVLIVALVGGGLWWFMPTKTVLPEKMAAVPPSAKITPPKPMAPPAAQKLAAPAPVPQVAVAKLPEAAAASADPQADLKTAMSDIAGLYREGDMVALWQTYDTPEQWAKVGPEMIQNEQNLQKIVEEQPQFQATRQRMSEAMAQAFDALASQTPTYNATGDEATYQRAVDLGGGNTFQDTLTFIKINGRWYLKSGN